MGRPDFLEDDRYSTGAARAKNQETLVPLIQEWLLSFADNETMLATCLENRMK
jgi:crotonobetainyl-CoA:carnitine CoA-transferase CaiB-like acyl-CoA transferase